MSLKLRAVKGKAVFEFENDGMRASMELLSSDSGPELVVKLDRLLGFLRREKLEPQPGPLMLPALPVQPVTPVLPLGSSGWQAAQPQFTGVAPVQPPPLADSLAKIQGSQWEIYDESNMED